MRKSIVNKIALVMAAAGGIILLSCSSTPDYGVPYYKGGKFVNPEPSKDKGFFSYLKMRLKTEQAKWPQEVSLKRGQVVPENYESGLKVYYINHSTFLLQIQGLNILTDPVFSERTSPVTWAGPKRVIKPGVKMTDLPPIDVILLSHDHYDHLDVSTLEWLTKRDNPRIFMGLGVGENIETKANRKEFKWYQSKEYNGFVFTFLPAQHFSGRSLFDRNSTLWGSWAIEVEDRKVYFAGDTGYSPHFKEIGEKFGGFDLALIPIGAYDPRYFMAYAHVDPEQALKAHQDLKSNYSLGMHWGTFQLTNEPRKEPKQLLLEWAKKMHIDKFWVPENTDCFELTKAKALVTCGNRI